MTYQQKFEWLAAALTEYRDTPPKAWKQRFVDGVLKSSSRTIYDDEQKKLHNLIVLEYISETRRTKSAICKALHISRQNYEIVKKNAIDRLCVLAFGVDGIDWSCPKNDPTN